MEYNHTFWFLGIVPYKIGEVIIQTTLPQMYTDEFCLVCDKDRQFLDGCYCIACGAHSPFGDWHDYNIYYEDWEKYFKKYGKRL